MKIDLVVHTEQNMCIYNKIERSAKNVHESKVSDIQFGGLEVDAYERTIANTHKKTSNNVFIQLK